MTKAELIAAISEKAGLKPDQAKTALDAFTSCVGEALGRGEPRWLVPAAVVAGLAALAQPRYFAA